jgi:hypothetical protein
MTTYFTGNPIGSTAVQDLYDNAQNFDLLLLGSAASYLDRLGVLRQSWAGMQQLVNDFIVSMGFEATHLVYVDGSPLVVDRPTQLIDRAGSVYKVKMPATFPVNLSGTWATDQLLLVDVGDASLRAILAAAGGAGLVGYGDGETYTAGTVGAKLQALSSIADTLRGDIGFPIVRSAVSQFVGQRNFGSVIHIGDSNPAGTGQGNGFYGGWGGRFCRSYMNSQDRGFWQDRGYLYETLMDCIQFMTPDNGFGGTGSFVAGGAANARLLIEAGEYVYRTGVEISQLNVFYGYDDSTIGSTWTVSVDGEAAASGVIGVGGSTGDIALNGGEYIRADSQVRFTCDSGAIYVQGWRGIRKGTPNASMMWVAVEGSQGFSDFSTNARMKAIADEVNFNGAASIKLWIISLGTNNIIDTVGKQLTVVDYIDELDTLISQIYSFNGGSTLNEIVVDLPPNTGANTPFAPIQSYWAATVAYVATKPGMSVARTDLTPLGTTTHYLNPDLIHFTNEGHTVKAQMMCDHFGIQMDTWNPVVALPIAGVYGRGAKTPAMLNTWVNGAGAAAMTAYRNLDGQGRLVGQITKAGGSGNNASVQVRANVRPPVPRPLTGIMLGTGEAVAAFLGTDGIVTLQLGTTELNAATLVHFDCTYAL